MAFMVVKLGRLYCMSPGQRKPRKAQKATEHIKAQVYLGKMFLWWSARMAGLHEQWPNTLKGKPMRDFRQPR